MMWRCQCDCGKTVITRGSSLLAGTTRSCGCLVSERTPEHCAHISESKKTHGMSHDPELRSTWSSWSMMMQRCFNPKRMQFHDYGGRGIKPCAFIKESPLNLLGLIGKRPEGTSIERINNSLGYTCGQCDQCKSKGWPMNVKWENRSGQSRNKRNNVFVVINGISKLRHEWAKDMGVSVGYIRHHYKQNEISQS